MIREKCRSCGAAIIWAVTDKDQRIPLDPEPVDAGNIVLREMKHGAPQAIIVTPHAGEKRYISHFATCPHAKQWRRK